MKKATILPKKAQAPTKGACVISALKEIGEAFARRRAHTNKTLSEVSEASGLSTVWLSKLERGMHSNASLDSLYAACEAVGVKLSFRTDFTIK